MSTLGKWTMATYAGKSASGKTDLWVIRSVANGETLGEVRWFGRSSTQLTTRSGTPTATMR